MSLPSPQPHPHPHPHDALKLDIARFAHPEWMDPILGVLRSLVVMEVDEDEARHRNDYTFRARHPTQFALDMFHVNACAVCTDDVLDVGGDNVEECADGGGRVTLECGHVVHVRCVTSDAFRQDPFSLWCNACKGRAALPPLHEFPVPLPVAPQACSTVKFLSVVITTRKADASEESGGDPFVGDNWLHLERVGKKKVVKHDLESSELVFDLDINDQGGFVHNEESRAAYAVGDHVAMHAAFWWWHPSLPMKEGCMEYRSTGFHTCCIEGIWLDDPKLAKRIQFETKTYGPFSVVLGMMHGKVKWAYAGLTVAKKKVHLVDDAQFYPQWMNHLQVLYPTRDDLPYFNANCVMEDDSKWNVLMLI